MHVDSYHYFSVIDAAKPQVMLIGQYSVGKTSFIRYLLGRDFPGQRIGPEPTTDRFTGTSPWLGHRTCQQVYGTLTFGIYRQC
jgi:GTPase SAR1 family protein